MLYRIIVFCLLGGFTFPIMAEQSHPDKTPQTLEKTVIELERSVAILQVSSASVEDYHALEKQIADLQVNGKLSSRVNFLSGVVFLLCIVLLICIFYLRQQSRQITRLIKSEKKESLL